MPDPVTDFSVVTDFFGQMITVSGALLAFSVTIANLASEEMARTRRWRRIALWLTWLSLGGVLVTSVAARWEIARASLTPAKVPVGTPLTLIELALNVGVPVLFLFGLACGFVSSLVVVKSSARNPFVPRAANRTTPRT